MAELTARVQVLFTPEQFVRLRAIARGQRRSVGALIREAVERTYPDEDLGRRLAAVRRLAEMSLPVTDWEQMQVESLRWPVES